MQSQYKLLGNRKDFSIGNNFSITREPWPFFDAKGGGIVFGDNVVVSAGVNILTHDHQFNKANWRELDEVRPSEPTVIENYVFLGINSIIMPTCKRIGKHSVIGAGAVVTKDVPDYEIWAGNPATKIGEVKHGE
jgi:acetyltransferase-like isoleucine patch superfamily enzyme